MPNEGFLRRWSRLKSSGGDAEPVTAPLHAPAAAPAPALQPEPPDARRQDGAPPPQPPLPTLEDVARLTPDADFSAFVARGVDKSVQRLALKKLFSDPHFNAIDGLDIYMRDYNQASPLTPDMLASLKHAPGVLDRLLGDRQEAEAGPADALALEDAPGPQAGPEQEQEQEQEHYTIPTSTQQGNA
ncbi:DUF3306 domain-containing protein [Massilia sp. UMI-21]|nr:DUF3306 domain-containing protein [Massilia sp. UMI-21]